MLERAFRAGVPTTRVTSNGFHGEDEELRRWLEVAGWPYLLAVSPSHELWKGLNSAPRREPAGLPRYDMRFWPWRRVKGDANSWWAHDRDWVRNPLAYRVNPGWERWLLTGRSVVQPTEYNYYRAYVPEGTSLATLARMVSPTLAVEEGLEQAKDEVGLDQYEVRRWGAWHRHVTLSLLAHAALQVTRARTKGVGDRLWPT